MSLGLVFDTRFEEHDTGPGHPERASRLESVRRMLDSSGIASRWERIGLEMAGDELLHRVHDADYVCSVAEACRSGATMLDSTDTAVCPGSDEIARWAAGSSVALVREVASGRLGAGFAAVRPPGHHAERDRAMGFCLFNNVAVAAAHLRAELGIGRVLIVDWDVHHGNGTQHIFETDPDVFYFSLHQWPLYPGTGARAEKGLGAGEGATLNHPLPPGSGDAEFLAALRDDLAPAAERFRPEFVLISAGFDAHERDPLAQLAVTTEAYREATGIVHDIAVQHAKGRLVSLLEGGYDLDALADSLRAHLETLERRAG